MFVQIDERLRNEFHRPGSSFAIDPQATLTLTMIGGPVLPRCGHSLRMKAAFLYARSDTAAAHRPSAGTTAMGDRNSFEPAEQRSATGPLSPSCTGNRVRFSALPSEERLLLRTGCAYAFGSTRCQVFGADSTKSWRLRMGFEVEYRYFWAFEDENARLTGVQRLRILGVLRLKFLSFQG